MALEKSDWFSVTTSIALFGGGLYMSTLAHEVIRVTELVITVAGVAGLIFGSAIAESIKGVCPGWETTTRWSAPLRLPAWAAATPSLARLTRAEIRS